MIVASRNNDSTMLTRGGHDAYNIHHSWNCSQHNMIGYGTQWLQQYKHLNWTATSEPRRHAVEMNASAITAFMHLYTPWPLNSDLWPLNSDLWTLTSELWPRKPWKPFKQCPLAWWTFVASFTEISPPSTEISHHAEQVLTDGQTDRQTDRQTENGKHNA